jgi:hypothetical protein
LTCLLHGPWSIVSWGLTYRSGESEPNPDVSSDKPQLIILEWLCRQLIGGGTNAVGALVEGGRVCDAFSGLFPPTALVLPWVLLGQGVICLFAAPLALALLLRTVGQGKREIRQITLAVPVHPTEIGPTLIHLCLALSLILCLASPPAGWAGFQATRLWFAPPSKLLALRPFFRRPDTSTDSLALLATMYNWAIVAAALAVASTVVYLRLDAASGSEVAPSPSISTTPVYSYSSGNVTTGGGYDMGEGFEVLLYIAVALLYLQVSNPGAGGGVL